MIPVLLLLLAVATVYVGTIEAAFSALMRLSLRLVAERDGRSDALGRYLDDPVLLFVPVRILLGVIFSLVAVLLVNLFGASSAAHLAALLVAMAAFVLAFEHLVPQLIARRDPERTLELLLPSFSIMARVLQPVTRPLVRLSAVVRRERFAPPPNADAEGEGDVTHAYLEAGEEQGLIEREERRLLQSIVDFGDTLVREVMTPRPDIVAIQVDATLDALRALFREQEYSRIPVYKEHLDNILGFVFVKDLIQLTDAPGESRPISTLMRPAHVVPETKRVSELLKEFQRRQVQVALVVDEYGGTAGLVTLEDLLEEIVGEIRDEYDVETEPIVEEGGGRFVFSGKVDIDELADRLGLEIERQGFETVGGYLMSHLGRVPAVGETFEIDGLTVEVLEAERRRVTKIRVSRSQPVAETEE